jgi:sec-independent protein translocase protein TatA
MERKTTMGSFSVWHWLIALLLLLYGRGKIPELMGDVVKGIMNFKTGMAQADRGAGSPPVDRHTEEKP